MQLATLPLLVDAALLEQLSYHMERAWRDLSIAESRGLNQHVLDRLFDTYIEALRAYDAALARFAVSR